MRKHIAILTALMIALLLCGCAAAPAETLPPQPTATPETEAAAQIPTEIPTEPAAPTEVPTEVATEKSTEPAVLPYLQKVTFPDQSIFSGPGYDYAYVGTVREAGTYTIVEEAWDAEDNRWGRLKSGAGWIDLTEVRLRLEFPEPISVSYTEDSMPGSDYHHYVGCAEEYAVSLVFRAHEELTDLRLYSMTFNETMELHEELFTLSRLGPEKPLVAKLDFPGDMTTFAILFTDSAGNDRYFTVYLSGRNGLPILSGEAG